MSGYFVWVGAEIHRWLKWPSALQFLTNNSPGPTPALVLVFFDNFGKRSLAYFVVGLRQLILS